MSDIESALDRAEAALARGDALKGTGFWRVVDDARRDRATAHRYGERIAAIDRRAFEAGVRARVPLGIGLTLLVAGTVAGLAAMLVATWLGTPLDPDEARWYVPVLFLAGFAVLLVSTHSLAHWVVGRIVRIRFTHVFLGGPPPPRPGVKTDYASYLQASPRARAAMHASGAILTKLLPFAAVAAAIPLYERWPWVTWVLVVIGVVQIVTDVVLSTKLSDWKKVKRELRAARAARPMS